MNAGSRGIPTSQYMKDYCEVEQQVPFRQSWGYKKQDEKKTFLAERAAKHSKRWLGEVFKTR